MIYRMTHVNVVSVHTVPTLHHLSGIKKMMSRDTNENNWIMVRYNTNRSYLSERPNVRPEVFFGI